MFINYFLWIVCGLGTGYLVFYFDLNKKKDLQVHLFVGTLVCFLAALIVQTVIWNDPVGDVNFVAAVVGIFFSYIAMTFIDYFFHI